MNIRRNRLFLFQEIIKKNFAAKYKDSTLGILWSFLKPLSVMILMTIVFSTLFKGNIINYPVYLLSGKCIYDFFNFASIVALSSIKGNGMVLKKTNAPKHIFILGAVFSEFINFLITLLILIGVMIVTGAQFYFNTMFLSIIPIISLLILLTGLGFILSILCIYYSDIQHLWTVVTMMVMYASAVFYPMDIVPEPFYNILILNPLYWIIDQFRNLVIYGVIPDTLNIVNSLLLSLIVLVIGIIIFKKYEKKVAMKF